MKIEHIALWCKDLEKMKTFYTSLFGATANDKYTNPNTGFSHISKALSHSFNLAIL
jgi:lactoylglutathione lyase